VGSEIDLSGEWRFQIDSLEISVAEKWYANELNDNIELPGSMPQQSTGDPVGYDTKFTGNTWKEYEAGKSWVGDDNYKPYLSDEKFRYPFWLISDYYYAGAAWYQKEVVIQQEWVGEEIELLLERCHLETRVWINGEYIQLQNGLGVPHRYNIGNYLKGGKNIISIRVDNRVKDIDVGVDAHSVTDNTQSNWNGIVGEINLIRRSPLFIANVKISPKIDAKVAKVTVELQNKTDRQQSGQLKISASPTNSESTHEIPELVIPFVCEKGSKSVDVNVEMGDGVMLWDEYNPNLYQLTVQLEGENSNDEWKGTFGMRDFRVKEKEFVINGRPVFLRGTLESAIFPKTGFPATDVESWERIMRICKEHGLNHIRFHSWCPPKAAFTAADNLGVYLQVEASAWTAVGDGAPIDQWVYKESEQIVREYGNHPSFCLMAYGNEPGGENHPEYLREFVEHWKAKDDRRVYTTAAGWPIIPENDFHIVHRGTRIQGWNQNLESIINKEAPRSDYNWNKTVEKLTAPMISHEVGQWCVYPNFNEVSKYDGVLKATNFEIFKASLESHGMLHLADDFVQASGKLQALCYKADIEAAYRTSGFGGFQLLDLHDFPGQGTALVGVLDPFWDEKGYISPEEFRQFSNETFYS